MGRERWHSRAAFVLAAIGSAVGLGNVWRFPYMAYNNGGGAFLIPYFFALLIIGIPVMIIEFGLGSKMQAGPSYALEKVKKGTGWIGWGAVIVSYLLVAYYAIIIAWCWVFLFKSITVAWAGHEKVFFFEKILQISKDPASIGGFSVPVLIGSLITWITIYLIIFKGLGPIGKVAKITVILPIILLAIIFIRGITLPGSIKGIIFYLQPNFSKLLNAGVWISAFGQIFFSLSLGMGVMIAYSSFIPRDSDVNNNSFITCFANCGVSFFAGFAVFTVLGYLSYATGQPFSKVVSSGIGLAFVVFPTAIAKMPLFKSVFGVIFFMTLLSLGINSAFSLVEGFITNLRDLVNISKERASLYVCAGAFLLGLIFTTKAGLYWLDIIDHYVANLGMVTVALVESILVGWFFGVDRFRKMVNETSEIRLGKWFNVVVKYIIPITLITMMTKYYYEEFQKPYGGYPVWCLVIGAGLVISCFVISYFINKKAVEKE
ncbi:MAG TPA: sodium-dependent transporter [Deltaproteobacteria bacterium]|nr:MAG: sodium-dependent transporter [Deltaproteobacteria bacterium]HDM78687.1 sodium-dependent transporter [Deltaproteobacteria bacterium]